MKKLHILKLLSAIMIPVGLYPLYAVLYSVFWLHFSDGALDSNSLPGLIPFIVIYASGYFVSFLLIRTYTIKRLRAILAVCCYAAVFAAAMAVWILTWRDDAVWLTVFNTIWTLLLLLLAVYFGPRHYGCTLSLPFDVFLGASLILAVFLNWFFTCNYDNLLLYTMLIFAFIIVLLNNQEVLDSRILVKNRINSSIPINLRRMNVFMITVCFAIILLLLLARDFIASSIKAVASFAGALLIRFLTWLFALFNKSADNAGPAEPEAPGPLEPWAEGDANPIWNIIGSILLAILLMLIIILLVRKILPRIRPAIHKVILLIKGLLQRLFGIIVGESTDETELAYSDSIEELKHEKHTRKHINAKSFGLRQQDPVDRIRYIYSLMLLRVKKHIEIKPSDTAREILHKTESLSAETAMHELTSIYEAVRYGDIVPDEQAVKKAKGLAANTKLNKQTKHI